jgi:hypothetical protein
LHLDDDGTPRLELYGGGHTLWAAEKGRRKHARKLTKSTK